MRKDFCSPDTIQLVQDALTDCSTTIDVSVSRITFDARDDPGEEMKKCVSGPFAIITLSRAALGVPRERDPNP